MLSYRLETFYSIVPEKWNKLIQKNPLGGVFYLLDYVDSCCENALFIIYGDYQGGMVLPFKIKFRIETLYTPPFFPFSSWVGEGKPSETQFWEMTRDFQQANFFLQTSYNDFQVENRVYQTISESCELNQQALRKIKKAEKQGYICRKDEKWPSGFNLVKESLLNKFPKLRRSYFSTMSELLEILENMGVLRVYQAVLNDEVQACLYFIDVPGFVYFFKGGSSKEARENGVMYWLMYQAIQDALNTNKTFDFGGANAEGLRQFNLSFGAKDEVYQHHYWSKGPQWFILLRNLRNKILRKS